MERLDHRTVDLLYGCPIDLNTAPFRYPRLFSFPQNCPTAVGRQDFHCLLQGHSRNLIFVGQPSDLSSQGIQEIQFLIHREKLYGEALDTATQRFDVMLWSGSRYHEVSLVHGEISFAGYEG